jgi:hypothetical protein
MAQVVAAGATSVSVLGMGAAVLFFLVLAMNGFSEAQARPVFISYFCIVFVLTAGSAATAVWSTGKLVRAWSWPAWGSGLASVAAISVAAGVLLVLSAFVLLVVLGPGGR